MLVSYDLCVYETGIVRRNHLGQYDCFFAIYLMSTKFFVSPDCYSEKSLL